MFLKWYMWLVILPIGAVAQPLAHRLDAVMKQAYPDQQPGAVLWVKKGDDLMVRKGYGLTHLETGEAISTASHFRLASVSKQFTAKSIFLLQERGKLPFDTPLGTIFSELPNAVQSITVGQLLNHTSGIWDYESLMPDTLKTQLMDADVLSLIRQKNETYFTPGTKFRYSNTGYCLLALIVEKISKMAYPDFVKQYIFDPLKMEQAIVYEPTDHISHRAYGYHPVEGAFRFADQSLTSATKGDGGVYVSAQEYGLWADAIIREMESQQDYADQLKEQAVPIKEGVSYSLGWFMTKEADGSMGLFHSGESTGFHNIVYINPSKKITIAILSNRDDMAIANVFEEVIGLMGIKPLPKNPNGTLFNWLNQIYSE